MNLNKEKEKFWSVEQTVKWRIDKYWIFNTLQSTTKVISGQNVAWLFACNSYQPNRLKILFVRTCHNVFIGCGTCDIPRMTAISFETKFCRHFCTKLSELFSPFSDFPSSSAFWSHFWSTMSSTGIVCVCVVSGSCCGKGRRAGSGIEVESICVNLEWSSRDSIE